MQEGEPLHVFQLPFEVRQSADRGRWLAASRFCAAGEQIYSALPWLLIIRHNFRHQHCQYCSAPILDDQSITCRGCNGQFCYCGIECMEADSKLHSTTECTIWKELSDDSLGSFNNHQRSLIRVLIRIISAQETEQESAEGSGYKRFRELVGNREVIERDHPKLIQKYEKIYSFVASISPPSLNVQKDNLIEYLCILQCNAFELCGPQGGTSIGITLYPDLALTNHSCVPNCVFIKERRNKDMINTSQQSNLEIDDMPAKEGPMMRPRLRMVVCTLTDVEAEEELSISYISLKGLSTHKRKEKLAKSWFFDCTCRGCSDPYETDCYRFVLKHCCPIRTCEGYKVLLSLTPKDSSWQLQRTHACTSCSWQTKS